MRTTDMKGAACGSDEVRKLVESFFDNAVEDGDDGAAELVGGVMLSALNGIKAVDLHMPSGTVWCAEPLKAPDGTLFWTRDEVRRVEMSDSFAWRLPSHAEWVEIRFSDWRRERVDGYGDCYVFESIKGERVVVPYELGCYWAGNPSSDEPLDKMGGMVYPVSGFKHGVRMFTDSMAFQSFADNVKKFPVMMVLKDSAKQFNNN